VPLASIDLVASSPALNILLTIIRSITHQDASKFTYRCN
jgi:hypothetical protein